MNSPIQTESAAITLAIDQFLQARLETALDKVSADDAESRQKQQTRFQRKNWLDDAAKRVDQIQLVTHALKYSHPAAKGSSLYQPLPDNPPPHPYIGSHLLDAERHEDVVGNAAALDVYAFLKIRVAGKTLLQRCLQQDPALLAALSDDPQQSQRWCQAFAGITEPNGPLTSHKLAKQLYFPLGDGEYHLLAPLFPTSLVHQVHLQIREDRFGESAKAAREAHRAGQPHPHGYREYPNLAIQNFGGTKPQNISQLNSERRGENWLLPSLPPHWRRQPMQAPLQRDTVFGPLFGRRPRVPQLVKALGKLLSRSSYNNSAIRQTRSELTAELVDELLQFAAEIQQLPGNWSSLPECRLPRAQQLWLDPQRCEQDDEFASQYHQQSWSEEICEQFARWLNARLKQYKLPVGDSEYLHWKHELQQQLSMIRKEIACHV